MEFQQKNTAWNYLAPFDQYSILENNNIKLISKGINGRFSYELVNKETKEKKSFKNEITLIKEIQQHGITENEMKKILYDTILEAIEKYNKVDFKELNFYYIKMLFNPNKDYFLARKKNRILIIKGLKEFNCFKMIYLDPSDYSKVRTQIEIGDGELIKFAKREGISEQLILENIQKLIKEQFENEIKTYNDIC